MMPVYLICGVSGSGKTWVCEQLKEKFTYVPHDLFYNTHALVVLGACNTSDRPVITECPFGERPLRAQLENSGIEVRPYFVIEDPHTVKARYEAREKKPFPKNAFTRAGSIVKRAQEWNAPFGSSAEVLKILQEENPDDPRINIASKTAAIPETTRETVPVCRVGRIRYHAG